MDERRSDRFGRYEILNELGRGAMGVVYRARDPKINRIVAVKTVSMAGQAEEAQQEYRERFFREAEAAGRLSHPGIVTIFDVGEEPVSRSPYIVMEYVKGQTLDQLLQKKDHKLALDTALQFTLEIADALDCAHGHGVVHRDLKPANILLTSDGHPKIADFGIAKLNRVNDTSTGVAIGTPAYMSPEQVNGGPVDGRSDLFSLGVILYTALTGYRPFQGNSSRTVQFKVVNRDPVPATVLDTALPPGADYIVSRAIAKDPAERYQRGMEMVLDIQDLREGRELWSRSKEPRPADVVAAERTGGAATSTTAGGRSRGDGAGRGKGNVRKVFEQTRKTSVYAAAFLLVVAMIFSVKEIYFEGHSDAKLSAHEAAKALPVASAASTSAASTSAAPDGGSAGAGLSRVSSTASAAASVVTAAAKAAVGTLDIEVDHKFNQATFSVFVDDRLRFTHPLKGADDKHLGLLRPQVREFYTVPMASGKHSLRVEVASEKAGKQSSVVAGSFAQGKEKLLQVTFDKHGVLKLSLN